MSDSYLAVKILIIYFTSTWTVMLLDSCISVDTWITFNFECKWRIWYLMGHRDLTNDTMCSLRYINKVADMAAGCHLILYHSWSLLKQHSLKRKNVLRKGLPLGRKKCTWRLNTALKVKKHTLFFRWFLDKHMRLEHLFDIYAKVLMPAHHLEFYIVSLSMFWSLVRLYHV